MITDATAATLARDLIVYRELLSVALERLHETQRQLAARDAVLDRMREEQRRYLRREVGA